MIVMPEPLRPGDRVALLCASSAVPSERLEPSLASVRAMGLEPVPYPSCYDANRHGYFAADDAQRAKDLQDAFADPSVRGIVCVRGGYGAGRLLPLLDWQAIARTPKPLFGYSDVTALHIALQQLCSMGSYHTPMPSTEWYIGAADADVPEDAGRAPGSDRERATRHGGLDPFTEGCLRRALFGGLTGSLELGGNVRTLAPGRAEGPLCGGNLSLVCDSLGTPWELDTRGKLLFLEDVNEKTYRLDGMLTQLRNAGKFDDCAGVLLGEWVDCTPEDPERTLTICEILEEVVLPAGKPVLAGLACGHALPTMSFPLGAAARMDAAAGTLEVAR